MHLNDIKKQVEEDMPIDDTELDVASVNIPQLHNKYLNIFTDEKLAMHKIRGDLHRMIKLKWEYYTGKLDQETLKLHGWEPFQLKILRQDLDIYMDSDDDVLKLRDKLTYQEEKVNYLEATLKAINNRQWNIRSAIEWRKFINGT